MNNATRCWTVSSTAIAVWALLAGMVVLLTGCLEQGREDYRDAAAEAFCDEALRCGNLGTAFIAQTHSECVLEMRSAFNRRWPADQCDQGRIDPENYDRCMSRMLDVACETGIVTRLDAYLRCRPKNVCSAELCKTRLLGRCLDGVVQRFAMSVHAL